MLIIFLFVIVIVLTVLLSRKKTLPDIELPPFVYSSTQSNYEVLRELRATEELMRDYVFVMPEEEGYYLGKKVMKATEEMFVDPKFLRSQGKWERRK